MLLGPDLLSLPMPVALWQREGMSEADTGQPEAETAEQDLAQLVGKSVRVDSIYLATGLVLRVGDPWPGPDGNPREDLHYQDEQGQQQPLKLRIAAILEHPEEAETSSDGDSGAVYATTRHARFEVWPDPPTEPVRFLDIASTRVVWTEKLAPAAHMQDRVTQSIIDNVIEEDEAAS